MNTRCKPGDLAIVIQAQNPGNVGLIVRVVGLHNAESANFRHELGPVWQCECAHPMTWLREGRTLTALSGPIPDQLLQPIRGMSQTRRTATQAEQRSQAPVA